MVELADRLRGTDTRFAVTGATGWLGRGVLELLAEELGTEFGDRVSGFASRSRELRLDSGQVVAVQPLDALPETPFDVLVHYAFLTRERVEELGHDAYVAGNRAITETVLRAVAAHRPAAIVYASSGAVYGAGGNLVDDLAGDPYATLKHQDERALQVAAEQIGSRSLVLRVFNVAGPWLAKGSGFAVGDLLLQAAAGGPIHVRADRPVWRSYVDVSDLAAVAVAWALAPGPPGTLCVDTAGEREVELGELAALAGRVLAPEAVEIERHWDANAAPSRYVGDGSAFRRLAGDLGITLRTLEEQVARTAAGLGLTPPVR